MTRTRRSRWRESRWRYGGDDLVLKSVTQATQVDRRFTSDGVKREQCGLWCELAKVAWTIHLVRPVLMAAAAVQQVVWDEKGADKDMMLQQAQVHTHAYTHTHKHKHTHTLRSTSLKPKPACSVCAQTVSNPAKIYPQHPPTRRRQSSLPRTRGVLMR